MCEPEGSLGSTNTVGNLQQEEKSFTEPKLKTVIRETASQVTPRECSREFL